MLAEFDISHEYMLLLCEPWDPRFTPALESLASSLQAKAFYLSPSIEELRFHSPRGFQQDVCMQGMHHDLHS